MPLNTFLILKSKFLVYGTILILSLTSRLVESILAYLCGSLGVKHLLRPEERSDGFDLEPTQGTDGGHAYLEQE